MNLIVAIDDKCGIGKGGAIPWTSKEDMKFFRATTFGKTVIMGRVTFESLGKPLFQRRNIVITSSDRNVKGVEFYKSLESAITNTLGDEIFIIGGESIYKEALEKLSFDRIFISHIKGDYECDKFFPMEIVKARSTLYEVIERDGLFIEVYVP